VDNPYGLPTDSQPAVNEVNTAPQPNRHSGNTVETYTYPFLRDKVYGFA